jgi:hypothetical protein
MAHVNGLDTRQLRKRRRPVHVAVAHQNELGIDAFRGERLGKRIVENRLLHVCGARVAASKHTI